MKRTILSLLVAGLFAGIGTSAIAQDAAAQPAATEQSGASPGTDSNSQQPAKSAGDPAAGGATASKQEQEYLAAVKKCESLTGTEKTKCVDAAKKKNGQL
jgi:hypothetical protein